MGRKILLGFAGPGKVSHNNVKDLLADHLSLGEEDDNGLPGYPDDVDEIRIVLPVAEDFWTPTVELLWQWTDEYAEFPYEAIYDVETRKNRDVLDGAKEAIEAKNVGFTLIERLVEGVKAGDETALIVAWGEAGDEETEKLVDLAHAKDLKVLDITAGLDDLQFGDPEPEPEPEEKPTRRSRRAATETDETPADEEKPRPRRGAPRKTAQTAPEPADAVEEESVEAEASHARQKAQKGTEDSGQPEGDMIMRALQDSRWLVRSLDNSHAAMSGREEPVPCELHRKLEQAIEQYEVLRRSLPTSATESKPESGEKPKRTAGRPRSDGSPAQPRSARQRGVKEWFDADQGEDGEWVRAGRGRLPKGVKTRTVDPKTDEVISED